MPLTDSQLIDLLQIVLSHESDIRILKASLLAAIQIAEEEGMTDVQSRLASRTQSLLPEVEHEGTLKAVLFLQQIIAELGTRGGSIH